MSKIVASVSEDFGFGPSTVLRPPSFLRDPSGGPAIHGAFFSKDQFTQADPVQFTALPDHAWISLALDTGYDVEIEVDQRSVFGGETKPGMFSLVGPGKSGMGAFGGDVSVLHIYVPQALFGDVFPQDALDGPVTGSLSRSHRVMSDLIKWHRNTAHTDETDTLAYGALLQLATHLVRSLKPVDTGERLTPVMVRRVDEIMKKNLTTPLKVADLAVALDQSEAHFARAFRNTTGATPGEALRKLRMQAAKTLLENDTLGILEIAAEVGYADPSSFAKAFRDAYGQTPAQWRKGPFL